MTGQQAEEQKHLRFADSARVHIKMSQRGVALEGAVLRAPPADAGEDIGNAESGFIGCITSELPRGAGCWAGASGLCTTSALEKLR